MATTSHRSSVECVRAACAGATRERLREVGRRCDPANLFRPTHNVPPADEA